MIGVEEMNKETINLAKAILLTRRIWKDSWDEGKGKYKLMPPETAKIACDECLLDPEIASLLPIIVNQVYVWTRVKEWADGILFGAGQDPIIMTWKDDGI